SQNVVHSDSDLILHNSSVLIDKEPKRALPKTGSQSNNWITLAGVILLVIGLRITFMSYKKSKR
ncbi:LPXTG cell wall anchor domain-containing protein, partial [Enterococcus faecium]|nr:LPXTG cell wall anchor domain-containing protein [Enterococcus faecium]